MDDHRTIRGQDAAPSLGLFRDGQPLGETPAPDAGGLERRDAVASGLGCDPAEIEILGVCPAHPGVAAVDCPHHD